MYTFMLKYQYKLLGIQFFYDFIALFLATQSKSLLDFLNRF